MIAGRRAEKTKLENRVRAALLLAFGEVVVAIALFSFMTACMFTADLKIDRLDSQLKKLEPTVDKIHYYETQISELKPKLNLLADSRETTLMWSQIFQDLSHSMPESTWLSNVASVHSTDASANVASSAAAGSPATPAPKPVSKLVLTLRGTSENQRLVGDAMLKLGQFPEFKQVDLNFTSKGGNAEMEAVDFEVAAVVNEPKDKGQTNVVKN